MRPSPSEPCPPDAEEDTPGTPLLPTLEARPPALPKQLPPSPSSLPGRRRRRQVLLSTTWILPLLLFMTGGLGPAHAAATTRSLPTTTTTSTTTIQDDSTPPPPKVTDRVYFNVRISRSDGTFYVRDKKNDGDGDDDNNQDDQVFYARLVFELFGEVAPVTVQRFKSYLPTTTAALAMDDTDRPLPSYARSSFASYDEATGVIYGGQIPGLQVVEVNNGGGGGSALQYGNRLFSASLWLESRTSTTTKLRHVGKGLLTHALLDPTPVFGITTRTDTTELDATHVVFGRLVVSEPDDQERNVNRNNTEKNAADAPTTWHSGAEFLQRVAALPTYQAESSVVMRRSDEYNEGGFVEAAAQSIFQAQRSFFRNTAQALGDTRLDRVYTGKLLRRVEVTQAEILE
ncbi:hypothetical protein ACA910_003484 [Epithemia clementina (nom. ined.)]